MLSRGGTGPILFSDKVSEWQGLFSLALQLVKGRIKSVQPYPLTLDGNRCQRHQHRDRGPDKSLGSSPGPEITMALGCKQATYLSPLPQPSPLLICLFPQDITHSVSLGMSQNVFAHHNRACDVCFLFSLTGSGQAPVFSKMIKF